MEWLTAGASVLGGLINNIFAGQRQSQAQDFAFAQQEQNYANQRQFRRYAYQDTMADMRDAGLNPILAYQKGATGGTAGGIAGVSQAPVQDIGLGQAATTALAAHRQKYEIENMKQTNELLKEQTKKTAAEKETELNRPQNVEAATENLQAQTGYTFQQMQKGMADALQSTSLSAWIEANPRLAHAMIVAAWGSGKVGDTLAPFKDAISGLLAGGKNSAPSTNFNRPPPSGGSAKSNQNFDQKYGVPVDQMSPNSYKKSQPGWEPAPARPRGGWFDQRFYGGQ